MEVVHDVSGIGSPDSASAARYQVDDHVYVSPPYSKRAGEPYLVARIVDFIRPKVGEAAGTQSRVKLAFYLRPRDISSRYIADHRVLLATMHADDCPASYIRGKCRVYHRERLPCDLETYKRDPDSFYYHQLYDRYLHRYFDLVPTDRVQNAPPEALTYLNEHFEFVCCEVGMGHELSDALRGCQECRNADSVSCVSCKKIWHLQCTDPPLTKKPSTGYGWTCPPCNLAHEEELEKWREAGDPTIRPPSNKAVSMSKKPSTKGKEVAAPPPPSGKMKQTNGWPFRYFGQHSDPATITDPHDSFYPRASTRVGQKFQVTGAYTDGSPADTDKAWPRKPVKRDRSGQPKASTSKEGPTKPSRAKERDRRKEKKDIRGMDVYARGGNDTIDVLGPPMTDDAVVSQVEHLVNLARKKPLHDRAGVALLDRVLVLYHRALLQAEEGQPPDTNRATHITLRELGIATWSDAEIEKLAEGLEEHHDDLEEIVKSLPRKTLADVVNYYYLHHADLERSLDQPHDVDKWADGAGQTKVASEDPPPALDADNESLAGDVNEDGEPFGPCAVCESMDPTTWYKCPLGIGTTHYAGQEKVMCRECSFRWRHYAIDDPPPQDLSDKKGAKMARQKSAKLETPPEAAAEDATAASASVETPSPVIERAPTPPPKPVAVPKPCVICRKWEPKTSLATCSRCCMSGHFACCGLEESTYNDSWLCLMCKAYDVLRRPHPRTGCVVCPPRRLKGPGDPLSALDLYKPTGDNSFAHVICGLLHPELAFGDANLLQPIEGAVSIPAARWQKECFVCNQSGTGACVKCADCQKHFHVSCAWQSGFKFAFEIQPVKKKKQVQATSVRFQGETGAMEAKIWCRAHKLKSTRIVYDLNSRDTETDLIALQVFARNFKQARPADVFPLLRRALRLDAIIAPALQPEKPIEPEAPPSVVAALDMPLIPVARPRPVKPKVASSSMSPANSPAPAPKPKAPAKPREPPKPVRPQRDRKASAKATAAAATAPPPKVTLRLPPRRKAGKTPAKKAEPRASSFESPQAGPSSAAGTASAPYTPVQNGPYSPETSFRPETVDYAMSATSSSEEESDEDAFADSSASKPDVKGKGKAVESWAESHEQQPPATAAQEPAIESATAFVAPQLPPAPSVPVHIEAEASLMDEDPPAEPADATVEPGTDIVAMDPDLAVAVQPDLAGPVASELQGAIAVDAEAKSVEPAIQPDLGTPMAIESAAMPDHAVALAQSALEAAPVAAQQEGAQTVDGAQSQDAPAVESPADLPVAALQDEPPAAPLEAAKADSLLPPVESSEPAQSVVAARQGAPAFPLAVEEAVIAPVEASQPIADAEPEPQSNQELVEQGVIVSMQVDEADARQMGNEPEPAHAHHSETVFNEVSSPAAEPVQPAAVEKAETSVVEAAAPDTRAVTQDAEGTPVVDHVAPTAPSAVEDDQESESEDDEDEPVVDDDEADGDYVDEPDADGDSQAAEADAPKSVAQKPLPPPYVAPGGSLLDAFAMFASPSDEGRGRAPSQAPAASTSYGPQPPAADPAAARLPQPWFPPGSMPFPLLSQSGSNGYYGQGQDGGFYGNVPVQSAPATPTDEYEQPRYPQAGPSSSSSQLLSQEAPKIKRRRSPIPLDASCFNCGTKETPVWRRDDEHHVLCNSCGQYWKAHGKHRPLTLKGPKRIINKYAPQGRPPPGAIIKKSARREAALASPAAMSSSSTPHPVLSRNLKREQQDRMSGVMPSPGPYYAPVEMGQMHKRMSTSTSTSGHSAAHATPPLSPYPSYPPSPLYNHAPQTPTGFEGHYPVPGGPPPPHQHQHPHQMHQPPQPEYPYHFHPHHGSQPPTPQAEVDPALLEHLAAMPVPVYDQSAQMGHPGMYGNGYAVGGHQQFPPHHHHQQIEIDPALYELGAVPLPPGSHHDGRGGQIPMHMQQGGWHQYGQGQMLDQAR